MSDLIETKLSLGIISENGQFKPIGGINTHLSSLEQENAQLKQQLDEARAMAALLVDAFYKACKAADVDRDLTDEEMEGPADIIANAIQATEKDAQAFIADMQAKERERIITVINASYSKVLDAYFESENKSPVNDMLKVILEALQQLENESGADDGT